SHRRPRAWCTARTLCLAKLRVSPAATACNEISCAAGHGQLFTVATVRTCPPPLRKSLFWPYAFLLPLSGGGTMAPASKVVIRLTAGQRPTLQALVRTGTHPAPARTRAPLPLKADADGPDAWPDERVAAAVGACRRTASRVRQPFAAEGLDATLHKKRAAGRQYRQLDGAQEAQLIALACSP